MPLRVGLVGCGWWGRNILRDLLALGCVVEVADPGSRYPCDGAHRVVSNLENLDSGLDGYVIATPSPSHEEVILALARRGRPIFCEKPLALDVNGAERLAAALGDRLFVMHKWAYHGGIQALRAIAQQGELGPVHGVYTRRLQWGKPAAEADAVWELAIHDLTIIREIMGGLPPVAAARALMHRGELHGVTAILGEAPFAHLEVGAHWPGVERRVRVAFEGGLAMLDDPLADHISVVRGAPRAGERHDPDSLERRPIDMEWPLIKELRAFVDHLRGGPPPPTNARAGAEVVASLDGIRRAALAAQ